jgi:hypothetical protein
MKATIAKVNNIMFSQKTFWVMAVAVVSLVIGYIYFIHATVQNVASRQRAERALTELTSGIASMESHYMHLTSSVSIAEAYNRGFKNASSEETTFIKKKPTLGVLNTKKVQ